ncbi:GntR family transcriptional regulator [Aureimonas fodinaquatilis]|uniref:GntR family transcriptional regulator n=1 Tax=Aureimonas fodinaquatilis TaxID=2565783 RepID=A0A5B0E1C5_9HYPH|nr:GntR family transcriptional regulator [Aureimonas fodinaquatilis]KAA0972633.1 GntR family transcriptional regulator [Aureimonas fodinaquatilis]
MNAPFETSSSGRVPAYARICATVRASIARGSLPHGAVLLEGPLAELFNSSRSPVKQALAQLESEGLLFRFAGRGLMVGKADAPLRLDITAEMLADSAQELAPERLSVAETLYYEVEREILKRSLFGRFRVNELALARHYDVSRIVAREILLKVQQAGVVVKGEKAHWWIVPLDQKRLRDLYELRELLEPVALRAAAPLLPAPVLAKVAERLQNATTRFPDIGMAELGLLEEDLHGTCLSFCPNRDLTEALLRSRASQISGKHMQSILMRTPSTDAFLEEHLAIVGALQAGDTDEACNALLQHLVISREKGADRLAEFHSRFSATAIDYIMD